MAYAGGLLDAGYTGLIVECNELCGCGDACTTRIVQRGVTRPLQVYWTGPRGWGVRTTAPIPQGGFVCEYTGEVVRTDEARRRYAEYDRTGDNYLISLLEHTCV